MQLEIGWEDIWKSGWPSVYVADITTWDGKVQTQRLSPVAFILPHEIIFKLLKKRCGHPLSNRGRHTECQRSCGQSLWMPQRFCHSIGVVVRCNPMNWDCSEFLELILINLPGLPKDSGSTSWRLSHKNVAQGVTFNERYLKYSHGAFSSFLWGRCPAKDTMANLLCYSVFCF